MIQIKDKLGDWWSGVRDRALVWFRRTKEYIKRLWRKVSAIRWHDIEWFVKKTYKSTKHYLKTTPPKQILIDAKEVVLIWAERAWRWIIRDKKTRSLSAIAAVLVLSFAVFHFWLANLGRLHGQYLTVYASVKQARLQTAQLNNSLNENFQTDESSDFTGNATEIADSLEVLNLSQPPNLFISYALRNHPQASDNIDRLSNNRPQESVNNLQSSLKEYTKLAQSSTDALTYKGAENDIVAYLATLERSIARLQSTDSDFIVINQSETLELLNALRSEANLFEAIGDKQRFLSSQSQFNRELKRELQTQWQNIIQSVLPDLSEYESDYERLIYFNHNQYGLPTPEDI